MSTLAYRLMLLNRHDEASIAVDEAVVWFHELQKKYPEEFGLELARVLAVRRDSLLKLGHTTESATVGEEVVEIYRTLSQEDPEEFLPNLTVALSETSHGWSVVGDTSRATETAEETVAIYRDLAKGDRKHLEQLAISLNNLAARHAQDGNIDAAVMIQQEAIDIQRNLAKIDLNCFGPYLYKLQVRLAMGLREAGREPEAAIVKAEADKLATTLRATRSNNSAE